MVEIWKPKNGFPIVGLDLLSAHTNGLHAAGMALRHHNKISANVDNPFTGWGFSSCENVRPVLSSSRRTNKTQFVNAAPFTSTYTAAPEVPGSRYTST